MLLTSLLSVTSHLQAFWLVFKSSATRFELNVELRSKLDLVISILFFHHLLIEQTPRARIYPGNETHFLSESLLLTQVAFASKPLSDRSHIDILYNDDSGKEHVCHVGALLAGTVNPHFLAVSPNH